MSDPDSLGRASATRMSDPDSSGRASATRMSDPDGLGRASATRISDPDGSGRASATRISDPDGSGPLDKGEKEKFPRRPMLSVKPIGNLLQDPKAVAVVSPSVKPLETVSSSGSEVLAPSSQVPATATAPAAATASPTIHIANQQNIILNQQNLGEFLAQNTLPGSSFFIQGSDSQLPIITSVRGAVSQPADPSGDSLDPLAVQPARASNESHLPSAPARSATEINTPQTAISEVLQAGATTGDVIGQVTQQLAKGHVISGLAVNLTIINLASNIPIVTPVEFPPKQYTQSFVENLIKKARGKEVYCVDLENTGHQNLGFSVRTEINPATEEVTMYVHSINPHSLADRDGRLTLNDRILSIDGQIISSQRDATFASTRLASKRLTISILINRARYLDQQLVIDFKSMKAADLIRGNNKSVVTKEAYDRMKILYIENKNDNLGIDFTELQDGEGGVVKGCREGSVAFEAGVLQPGDIIHFIMGTPYNDQAGCLRNYVDFRSKGTEKMRFNLRNLLNSSPKVRLYITPNGVINKLCGPHFPHDTQVVTINLNAVGGSSGIGLPWQPNQPVAGSSMPVETPMQSEISMPARSALPARAAISGGSLLSAGTSVTSKSPVLARTSMPARVSMPAANVPQFPRQDLGTSQLSRNPPSPAIDRITKPTFYPVSLVPTDGSIRVHSTAGLYREVVSGQIAPSRTVDIMAEQVDLCNDRKGLGLELIRTDGLYIQKIRLASISGQDERLRQGDCILYISFVSGVDKKFINLSSEFDHQLTQTLNDVSQTAVSFRLIVCRKIRHTIKITSPFVDTATILKLEDLESKFDIAASTTGKTQLRVVNKLTNKKALTMTLGTSAQIIPSRAPTAGIQDTIPQSRAPTAGILAAYCNVQDAIQQSRAPPAGNQDAIPQSNKDASMETALAVIAAKRKKWKELLGPNYAVISASFNKRECPSKGLGVGLENKVEMDSRGNMVSCHYINKVVPTGAIACNGKIKTNDHLLQANEHILYNKLFTEVKDILKTLPASVNMFAARKVSNKSPGYATAANKSLPQALPIQAKVKEKEIPLISLDVEDENDTTGQAFVTNEGKKRQVRVINSHNTEIKPGHIQNVRITLDGMERNSSFYGHMKGGRATHHLPIQILSKKMFYTNHNLAKVARGCVEVLNRSNQIITLNSGILLGQVCEADPKLAENYKETSLLITLKDSFEGLDIPSGQTRDVSGFVHGLDDNLVSQLDNITTQFKINPIPSELVMPYKVETCTSHFFLLPRNEKSMVSVRFKVRNTSPHKITFSNPIGQPNIIAIAEILNEEDYLPDLETPEDCFPDLETVPRLSESGSVPQNNNLSDQQQETDAKSVTSVTENQSPVGTAVDLKDMELFCIVNTQDALSFCPNEIKAIRCPITMSEDEITGVFGETESREGVILLQDNTNNNLKMFSSLERIDKADARTGKATVELLVHNPSLETILLQPRTQVGSLYFKKYLPSPNSSFMKIVLRHDLSIASGNTSTVIGFIEQSPVSQKMCDTSLIMISPLSTEKLPHRTSSGCAKVNKCDVKCSTTGKTYSWCVSLKVSYVLRGKAMILSTSPLGLPIAKAELICQSIIGQSSEKCLELMAFNTLLPPFSITNITCKLTGVPELLSSYQIKAKLRKHKTKICLFTPHLTATLADQLLGQRNIKSPNRSQKVKVPLYNFTDKGVHISNDEPLASFSYVNVLNNTSSTSTPHASLPAGYAFLHKDGQHFPVVTKLKLMCSSEYWEDFRPILVTVPPNSREHLYGNTGLVTFVSAAETVAPFFVKPQLVSFDEKNKGEEMSFYIKVQLKSHSVNTDIKRNIVPRATFANKHLSISPDVLVAQLYLVTKMETKASESRVSAKAGQAWKRRPKSETGEESAKKKKKVKRESSTDDVSDSKRTTASIDDDPVDDDDEDNEEIKLEDIKLFVDLNQQNRTKLLTEKQKDSFEHSIVPKHKKPHIVTLERLTECSVYLPDLLYLGETKQQRDVVVSHSLHYYSHVVSSRAQTKLCCKRCPFRTGDSVDLLRHLKDYHFSEEPQHEKDDSDDEEIE